METHVCPSLCLPALRTDRQPKLSQPRISLPLSQWCFKWTAVTQKHTHTRPTKRCKSLSPGFGNSLDSSRRKPSRSSNPQSKRFLLGWQSEIFPVIHSCWNPETIQKNTSSIYPLTSLFFIPERLFWWTHTVCLLPTFCSIAVLYGFIVTMEESSEDSNFPVMVKTALWEFTAKSNYWNIHLFKN